MMSCVKGSDLCAKSVLRKLEEALISHIDQHNIDRSVKYYDIHLGFHVVALCINILPFSLIDRYGF